MFSFAYPYLLLLLAAVPLFVALYFWTRWLRRKRLRKFGNPEVIKSLMSEASPYKPPIKITLRMIALTMIILGLCRPWGSLKDEQTTKEGIEVVIAVDASNSMLAPTGAQGDGSQRMRVAKTMLERLINRLDNDRVGLVVYAGEAYQLIPVTSDYVSARMFLNSIDPSSISDQGTNIGAAIEMAANSFSSDKKGAGKAIILITDAEELEDEEGVMKAAKAAAKSGIQIDVVGIGSQTPVTIPYGGSYIMDPATGEPVQTRINEDLAAKIAEAGKGIYVNASNREALTELEKQLSTVKKSMLTTSRFVQHDELYHVFVWIGLAFLILDTLVLDRKNSWLAKYSFFKKEAKN